MNYCVVTTINRPTKAIEELYHRFWSNLIIVGDKKTPEDWEYKGVTPMSGGALYAPDNHYARKNLGYMAAIAAGATLIYDTDDDNVPNEIWLVRSNESYSDVSAGRGWFNVYHLFSKANIWPRGFSLRHLDKLMTITRGRELVKSSIQQGLADGDPDVDAIWRLALAKPHSFEWYGSVFLNPNTWCPFNSQSTWWFPDAYPLLYLPVHATFRMTDIWRSFVAQRCLWEIGDGVTFHSPSEVYQERNPHDLLKDFADEIPGYLNNDRIVEILTDLTLSGDICDNMATCYQALVYNNILPEEELESLNQWVNDYKNATRNLGRLSRARV